MCAKSRNIFKPSPIKLTDDIVNRLVGHTNVVYYNCEKNVWNTNTYNGYKIDSQEIDTASVKFFKTVIEKEEFFIQHYEFAASITMTIDRASFPGYAKAITNPKYNQNGTAVVGNIIVKNKATGNYELYCKSWIGVFNYELPDFAVYDGAYWFADDCARFSDFRAAVCAAHARQK